MPVTLTLDEVRDLASSALVASGASPSNAAPVADSIRDAESDGIRNVGLGFLPVYCDHLRNGKVDGRARPSRRRVAPGCLRVDACGGFSHAAFEYARGEFGDMIAAQGIAIMAIARSYTAGVLGWFAEKLADDGWLAIAFANASPAVAAWGGRKPFFGTNPLAFAAPRAGSPPLVIDQSSSATAMVNVIAAAERGEPIPRGWALDETGAATTDPRRALRGSMAPAGGHKGSGMALIVDIMAAGLTGANFSWQADSLVDNTGGPPGVGQSFIAVDPDRFGPGFPGRLDALLDAMTSDPGVRLPGARRLKARERTRRRGVVVEESLHRRLLETCATPGSTA